MLRSAKGPGRFEGGEGEDGGGGENEGGGGEDDYLFSYRGYNCFFLFFRYLQWRKVTGH